MDNLLALAKEINPQVELKDNARAVEMLLRNRHKVQALFQSEEMVLVVEYLLSMKMLMLDELLEKKSSTDFEASQKLARIGGYSNSLDDFIGLFRLVKNYKLPE